MKEDKTITQLLLNESYSAPEIKINGETQKEILSSVVKALNEGSKIQDIFKLIGEAIIVDEVKIKKEEYKYQIYLEESECDDKKLDLEPLEKAIYLFYLLHTNKPIPNRKLKEYKEELSHIYQLVGNKDEDEADKKIDKLIDIKHTKLLSENCSRINKKINKKLIEGIEELDENKEIGKEIKKLMISKHFLISEMTDGSSKQILLPRNKIKWGVYEDNKSIDVELSLHQDRSGRNGIR